VEHNGLEAQARRCGGLASAPTVQWFSRRILLGTGIKSGVAALLDRSAGSRSLEAFGECRTKKPPIPRWTIAASSEMPRSRCGPRHPER